MARGQYATVRPNLGLYYITKKVIIKKKQKIKTRTNKEIENTLEGRECSLGGAFKSLARREVVSPRGRLG
jgi:hypothetical protein